MHHPVQCRSITHPSLIHHCLKFPFVMKCRIWILRTVSVPVTVHFSLITALPRKSKLLTFLYRYRTSRKVFW
ncbi:hypothetical protein LINGRAHAP2_LOCUS30632, partial [Linum grandiflorum]